MRPAAIEPPTIRGTPAWLASWAGGAALALIAGCAGLAAARIEPPAGLAADSETLTLEGLGGNRQGRFTLAGRGGRFERSASRLDLLNARVGRDSVAAGFAFDGQADEARCDGTQTVLTVGVLAGAARPFGWHCRWSGGAELELRAPDAAVGPLHQRQGTYRAPGVQLGLRSLHRLQGAAWPVPAPVGYAFTDGVRVVAALDLAGGAPRLWLPPAHGPVREAVIHGALALALLWDPAGREP